MVNRVLVYSGANVLIRGSAFVLRFILLFFLAATLSVEKVAQFGVAAAMATYLALLLGGEYYTYYLREFINAASAQKYAILKKTLPMFAAQYAIVGCVIIIVADHVPIGSRLLLLSFLIGITEHLSQEANRVLTALGLQIRASIYLFIRAGLWILALIPVFLISPEMQNVEAVLTIWLLFSAGGCVLAWRAVFCRLVPAKVGIEWRELWTGVRISSRYIVGLLFLKALFVVDRGLLTASGDYDAAAAYAFFAGGAATIAALVDAAVYVFRYPVLIALANRGDWAAFSRYFDTTSNYAAAATILLSVCALGVYTMAVPMLSEGAYQAHMATGWMLFAAFSFYALSYGFHHGLHALRADTIGNAINVLSFFVFIGLYNCLSSLDALAVPTAILAACFFLLAAKWMGYKWVYRRVVGRQALR